MTRHQLTAWWLLAALATNAHAQTLLADLAPGRVGSVASDFTPIDGAVLFLASTRDTGTEIWRTDGTTAGTTVLDLAPGPAAGLERKNGLYRLGSRVLCFGTDGARTGLFSTDGTPSGTGFLDALVVSGRPSTTWSDIAVIDGIGCFTAWTNAGIGALYRTDGTAQGTFALQVFLGDWTSEIASVDGGAFFTVVSTAASALWYTDGTVTGTRSVWGRVSASAERLTAVGSRVFFRERSASFTLPVWVSDGTVFGTTVVPIPTSWPLSIAPLGNTAMLLISPTNGNIELWRSDGTAAGTRSLAVLAVGGGGPTPTFGPGFLVGGGDKVYGVLGDSTQFNWVWVSDGTAAGTLQFWPPGHRARVGGTFAQIGNRLLFGGWVGATGVEPWVTDGTTAGTRQLAEIAAGQNPSTPWDFTLAADLANGPSILFGANDFTHGWEPWIMPAGLTGLGVLAEVREPCATGIPPRVEAVGAPSIGNAVFALRTRTNPGSPAALLIDTRLKPRLIGCSTLLPSLFMLSAVADRNGDATVPVPIPSDVGLVGARVFVQPAVPAVGGFVLGLADLGPTAALLIGN